jgi:hypothetical protein
MVNIDKNSESKKNDKDVQSTEKIWNDSEVQLLKKWGEIASSYRLLHDRAFRIFQIKSYGLTIPVIILSTISGTASFSISSFPIDLQLYVPMVIGGVNIFVGILQTITQFLRVNELTESHRVASISYGKFARNITTELSLPPSNRSYNGIDFVQMCRTEMDRLIEQSPIIPMKLLNIFDKTKEFQEITKPDVLTVSSIREYEPSEAEKMGTIMALAANKLEHLHKNEKTVVQKIQEKIDRQTNPKKDEDNNGISTELKNVMNNIDFKDLEANLHNKESNIDTITKEIINKRNDEIKDISSSGIVSRMLNAKNNN